MKLTPIPLPSRFIDLCFTIKEAGGVAYLVGGIVRDHLIGLPPKDIDIEIHHLEPKQFLPLLKRYGKPIAMGKAFGIWKLSIGKDEIDVSLPKKGEDVDIHMGLEESCRRRDLRVNAILYDPTTEQFHDPFQGIEDIQNRILQATDPIFFTQDSLRVLRVAQFAARFNFSVSTELILLCQQQDLSNIAHERVRTEFEKCWLKSQKPSIGIQHFIELKVIDKYFPEWPGLNTKTVQHSLDRGKKYCTDYIGWNMALFWALSLQQCTQSQAEKIMDTLNLFTYHNFNIREAVFCSLQQSKLLTEPQESPFLYQAAENFRLDFLCSVAASIIPEGHAIHNLEHAIQLGIDRNPLPKLIKGRDLIPLGISGKNLGLCLRFVRQEQLRGKIQNREEALQTAKNWKEEQ